MDNSPAATTLDTLRTVEFRLGLKGYNVDEVDEYLEKAAVEAESLQEQMRQLNERLRQATERIAELESSDRPAPPPAPAPAPTAAPAEPAATDDTLQRTLLLAQKFVDQTKRESEAEAREVVARAQEKARQLTSDAEQRLREEVSRLEGMRNQLSTDVETMARQLESERNRIRSGLTDLLKWIDENVQPAATVTATRTEEPRSAGAPRVPSPRPEGNGAPVGVGAERTGAPTLDLNGSSGRG
jgi:cell division initiation protein